MSRLLGRGLAAGVVAVVGWSTCSPASASPGFDGTGPSSPCIAAAASAARSTQGRPQDPDVMTRTQVRQLDRQLHRALKQVPATRIAAAAGNDVTRIPVAAHVLAPNVGSQPLGPNAVARQLRILNRAYAGRERDATSATPFRFRLSSTDVTVNRAWYHSDYNTAAERAMKRALHRGDAGVLNLYFVSPPRRTGTLGWATFPQAFAGHQRLDGVVVNVGSLVGGSISGYDRGDTAVHEIGHWLGLFHTFQGGCSQGNDHVTDTPAEGRPQFYCDENADTCAAPGADPIHNFMDYSYDSCMRTFTPGQSERMTLHWLAYRS